MGRPSTIMVGMEQPTPEQWQKVVDNTGLVWFHVNRCKMTEDEREEAFADGCLGLARAAQLFDPDLGYTFATYALYWIRQAVSRGIEFRKEINYRAAKRDGREYVAPVSLDMPVAGLGDSDPSTLGDFVDDPRAHPESDSMAKVRLAVAVAAMRSAARDAIDLAIIDGISDQRGWQVTTAAEIGVTREAVRRRFHRLRQYALAADDGAGMLRGEFDPVEFQRQLLDDPSIALVEDPSVAATRRRRHEESAARRAATAEPVRV